MVPIEDYILRESLILVITIDHYIIMMDIDNDSHTNDHDNDHDNLSNCQNYRYSLVPMTLH